MPPSKAPLSTAMKRMLVELYDDGDDREEFVGTMPPRRLRTFVALLQRGYARQLRHGSAWYARLTHAGYEEAAEWAELARQMKEAADA